MIDFNIFGKVQDTPLINTDIAIIQQQVDMLFNTDTESVLGDLEYGSNYDRYLYTTGISNVALENKIQSDIMKLDLRGYTPSVSVQLIEGTVRDIALIDITLTGTSNSDVFNKTYIIQ